MLKSISITTAAAVFAFSGLAFAAGTAKSTTGASGSTSQPSFSAVDKDHNGKISRSEWDSYFQKSGSSSAGGTSSKSSAGMSQSKAASGSSSSSKKY